MESLYYELEDITERLQNLMANVFKYNPTLGVRERVPLVQLGIEARSIGECLKTIGVTLLNMEKDNAR